MNEVELYGEKTTPIDPAIIAEINHAIRQKLAGRQNILIVSHIRPDGDAVGSLLGLGLALRKAGKMVTMALTDGMPAMFRHLAGSRLVERGISPQDLAKFDLLISVDASDLPRTGGILGERVPDLNIDHHVTNPNFAVTNLVIPAQAATSAIIAEYLPAWGLEFDQEIASALLSGIITDTIGFRTSNMNPGIFRLAAMLMEWGANLPDLYMRGLISKSYEAARYWGRGLDKLQRVPLAGGAYVWTCLSLEDRRSSGYPGNDDADLVNLLSSVEADLAVIFIEQKNGHVKVSWRSRPGIDVSQIALKFGGGGHPAAAGADIPGTMDLVQENVLQTTQSVLVRILQQNSNPA